MYNRDDPIYGYNDQHQHGQPPTHEHQHKDIPNNRQQVPQHKRNVVRDGRFCLVDVITQATVDFACLVLLEEVHVVADERREDLDAEGHGDALLEDVGDDHADVGGDGEGQ